MVTTQRASSAIPYFVRRKLLTDFAQLPRSSHQTCISLMEPPVPRSVFSLEVFSGGAARRGNLRAFAPLTPRVLGSVKWMSGRGYARPWKMSLGNLRGSEPQTRQSPSACARHSPNAWLPQVSLAPPSFGSYRYFGNFCILQKEVLLKLTTQGRLTTLKTSIEIVRHWHSLSR